MREKKEKLKSVAFKINLSFHRSALQRSIPTDKIQSELRSISVLSISIIIVCFFLKIWHIKYVFKHLQNPRPRRLYCPDAVNHSFHATSYLSHNRPPCCHCNPLIGCGDCCPGADEGVVTEQERQRQRGRAGGSQRSSSSMSGQQQKCSISCAVSTKDFLCQPHMCTRRQEQT